MKKIFAAILAIFVIISIFGGCSKRPLALDKQYKGRNYTWNEEKSAWIGIGPDIIDIYVDCTVDNWPDNTDCLDAFRKGWAKAGAHARIQPGSIQDKVLFRVIPENKRDLFYVEYDPAKDVLSSENTEKRNCWLDASDEGLISILSGAKAIAADEAGEYIGGTVVIEDTSVSLWQSGECYEEWPCEIEKPDQVRVLDRKGPEIYLYDTAAEVLYGLGKSDSGYRLSKIPYVVGADKASFGKRSAEITICNVDGELIATDNNGNRRVISSSFSEVRWPFILENGVWYICHCELKVLQDGEKGLPYIKTAIGCDEPDGYAERFLNAWFNESDTSGWREEYLKNLHL